MTSSLQPVLPGCSRRCLLFAGLVFVGSTVGFGEQGYRMRDTGRGVGDVAEVPLDFDGENRTVQVVTLSDDSTGLKAFLVDDLLSAEECAAIRATAPQKEFFTSATAKDFPVLKRLKKKAGVQKLFKRADQNRDAALNEAELQAFLQEETDLVDYNHTELLLEDLGLIDAAEQAAAGKSLSKEEFGSIDWAEYFKKAKKLRPHRFARDSSQAWIEYDHHKVLQTLLKKVAAVADLPHQLVQRKAEALQLLRYSPHGAHYSCHHDTAPDQVHEFRFMTFFLFLNDVDEGGETILFGTDLNRSYPKRRQWGEGQWGRLEALCQPTGSCPASGSSTPPPPFDTAAVIRPKAGRAVFWYNTEVDANGRGTRFVWSSIHGGCPTRGKEKWAANVWVTAGPAIKGHSDL